ncbi:MAG: YbbR-like domain-containing protein [Deltaproteobacteria bacterium]|nr:YbbR-like domain-containing protein [Deltaproteobacteria bacterium]TLN03196.1 MAG: YbbR-like domain-containing protein [bacterium]
MIFWRMLVNNLSLKLLALLLAIALWLLATGAKDSERDISIPLALRNLPAGLSVAGTLPDTVEVTVSGPRIRLLGLRTEELSLSLDLRNLREGTVTFSGMEKRLRIPPGITVMRIYPAVVDVTLVRTPRRGVK